MYYPRTAYRAIRRQRYDSLLGVRQRFDASLGYYGVPECRLEEGVGLGLGMEVGIMANKIR